MRTRTIQLALSLVLAAAPWAHAAEIENADQLLEALERADEGIETFRSDIVYDRRFTLQDDQHIRFGQLFYIVDDSDALGRPLRTFEVRFDTLLLRSADGEGYEQRPEKESWLFDGEWLIEKRFDERQYVARQVAPPDDPMDPLRLGEGPLPIPIGQRKADILSRYEAELLGPLDGLDELDATVANFREHAAGALQLRLVPLEHLADESEFREVRIWYRRGREGRLLPILAKAVDRKRDESFFQLADPIVNQPLPRDVLDTTPPDGWRVQREEGRFEERAGGRPATMDEPASERP